MPSQEPQRSISIDDDGLILLDATPREDRALFNFDEDHPALAPGEDKWRIPFTNPKPGYAEFWDAECWDAEQKRHGHQQQASSTQVIDLTLSDDEDEPPAEPPAKRLHLPNGYHA